MIISSKVPSVYNGYTALDYLYHRFTYLTKEQWQARISEGKIRRNDEPVDAGSVLKTNDLVSYNMPEFIEPPANLEYTLIFEDEWLLGVDKPGNLLVHHKGKSFKSNLIYHLRYLHNPPFEQADMISRLDRETSGVVMAAKHKEALRAMNRLVMGRMIHKEYFAVVHGVPQEDTGVIEYPIGSQPGSKVRYRYCINGENAKEAVTRYEVIERFGDVYAALRLFPLTGRTHQLRVHLTALGHCIVGDKLYGRSDDEFLRWRDKPYEFTGSTLMHRHALHCMAVSFIHPFTAKECALRAPLPEDIKTFINSLK